MNKSGNKDQLRIGVVGVGPVGATLAVHLIEAGAFVVPCDANPKIIDKIRESGIRLEHVIQKHVDVTNACYSVQELAMYDLDVAIIAVKTPHLEKVLKQLSEISSGKTFVVCAQNGIDNEVETASVFGEERTLRMVVNYAGSLSDPGTVHVSFFNPPNYLAALMPQGEEIARRLTDLLNSANLDTKISEDIQDYVWEKAILNAALSAVCAITRRTMKEVMDFPQTLELVEGIIDESIWVAEAEGIEFGKKFRRFCIRYLKNAGHHRPSMLTDLEAGHRTEIDYLNGKIVEYGRKHCIPTPLNLSVSALVRLLETSPK